MTRTSLAWALCLALLSSCGCPEAEVRLESATDSLVVCAERAVTPAERARGLMGRAPLEPGEGMLFEWPVETELCFFNRGVGFAIDIVFANADGEVVAIEREVPAEDEAVRCHVAMTVLEVSAAEAARFDAGDSLDAR